MHKMAYEVLQSKITRIIDTLSLQYLLLITAPLNIFEYCKLKLNKTEYTRIYLKLSKYNFCLCIYTPLKYFLKINFICYIYTMEL